MATDDKTQPIIEKLNGLLWLTDASEEDVERLAALLKANEPTDWLNIAVIDSIISKLSRPRCVRKWAFREARNGN
jgi:hypothetical protein